MSTFVPSKSFYRIFLIDSKRILYFSKLFIFFFIISEFSYIKVRFTDQNSKPLETEYKTNNTFVIN